jgi:aryl-alcohol dehydrogenase-like predicted oxidoreductase
MLPRRAFGTSGITHSVLVFGSMRLASERLTLTEAESLLGFLVDAGVDTFHSSHEYDTHPFFCEVLKRIGPLAPLHVVKLGEPHFDERQFRRERFIALVEQELQALGTERIAIVQWLLRAKPNTDEIRLPLLHECIADVEDTFARLRDQGKVGALAVFPYTPAVAEFCLARPSCAGLVSYLNLAEREMLPYLTGMQMRGQAMLAIRPLAAGTLLDAACHEGRNFADLCTQNCIPAESRLQFALRWPLAQPAVSGVVLSTSSLGHAQAAVAALSLSHEDKGSPLSHSFNVIRS